MINELRAIAIFVEVVRSGSFRAAAKQLDLSPSAVSYNIAQLEEHVGNALIYRSTRKLSLTREGEHLYEQASESLSNVASCLDKITGNSNVLQGRLKVSATTALLHSNLNRTIAQFCKDNENINFKIHYSDEHIDLVQDGIDVVLRAGVMPDSALKSKLVTHIHRKLVCSKNYFNARPRPKHPKDLDCWNWIRLSMMPNARTFRKSRQQFTTEGISSQLSVNSVDAMTQFCSLGMGLATPPGFLVEKQLKRGSLIEVLPDWSVDPIPVYAVWPGNNVKNKNAHRFIELVQQLV